jgi:thiamine biosynthesis lipoprotein ApbE
MKNVERAFKKAQKASEGLVTALAKLQETEVTEKNLKKLNRLAASAHSKATKLSDELASVVAETGE